VFASWDKDGYTERFLVLLPCTCVLQPELVHLYKTSSLLPGHLPIVVSVSLRWLYLLLYSGHVKHFQILGFIPFPVPPVHVLPLACDPCPTIFLHFQTKFHIILYLTQYIHIIISKYNLCKIINDTVYITFHTKFFKPGMHFTFQATLPWFEYALFPTSSCGEHLVIWWSYFGRIWKL
jgi:hypothetical protein